MAMKEPQDPSQASTAANAFRHAESVKDGGSPAALLATMVEMLEKREGQLAPKEEEQFVPLIRQIAERAEILVRRKLAEQIAALPSAPRGLLEFLAHDEIGVAEPLISQSMACDDEFLIDVLDEQGEDHAIAIAGRATISKTLSGAIIDTGLEQAILALLRNGGADIEKPALARIAGRAKSCRDLQQELINRNDLPTVIAQEMFWSANGNLRQQILERFSIRPGQLDILLEEAAQDGLADPEILSLRAKIQEAISPNAVTSRAPVSTIIEHIKAGRIAEFAKGVSSLLAVRKKSIQRIMADEGGEALAVLCRALNADRMQFTSVLLKNDYQRFGVPRPPGQIEQVSRIYDRISPESALATVQMWDALEDRIAA